VAFGNAIEVTEPGKCSEKEGRKRFQYTKNGHSHCFRQCNCVCGI